MRGQVLEIDCARPDLAFPVLRAMGVFSEVALYGALIHAVAADASSLTARIAEDLERAGAGVRSVDLIAPSLEDVFIASVHAPESDGTGGALPSRPEVSP